MAKTQNKISSAAIRCEQNGRVFYLTALSNKILEQTSFVTRRKENVENGFQRGLSEKRTIQIAEYLEKPNRVIPTPLILSAQITSNFNFDEKTNMISFNNNEMGFLIIDGQHRFFGFTRLKKEIAVPVVVFNGLDSEDEVSLFIDINTNQKGVPTSLLLDIQQLTGKETKKEERQRLLFDKLNKNSVISGNLSPNESKVGKISRQRFNSSTQNVFDSTYLEGRDDEWIYRAVRNYLEAFHQVFQQSGSQKARLNNATFFESVFNLFNDVVDKSLKTYSNLKAESIYNIIKSVIGTVDFDSFTGSNRSTVEKLTHEMKKQIMEYDKILSSQSDDIV